MTDACSRGLAQGVFTRGSRSEDHGMRDFKSGASRWAAARVALVLLVNDRPDVFPGQGIQNVLGMA